MKAMEEQLSAQTPSVESFIREVIQDMSPDEKSRYFKEMAPVLARLIKKDGDVCDLERALNSETGKISELDAMKINLLRTLVSKAPINEDQIAFIISSDNKESLSLGIRKQNTDEMRASLAMLREGGKQLEPEPADQEMHDVQEPATPAS